MADSLKAITALDLAANLLNCTKMTSSWLPWTEEFDPREGGTSALFPHDGESFLQSH